MKKIIIVLFVLVLVIVLAEPIMSFVGNTLAERATEAIFPAMELSVPRR